MMFNAFGMVRAWAIATDYAAPGTERFDADQIAPENAAECRPALI
jgi:hypothetical protein